MADNIYFERLELSDTFKEWRDKLNNLGTMIENSGSNVDNVTIFRNDNGEFEARDLLVDSTSGKVKASEYGQIGYSKNITGVDINSLVEPGDYISYGLSVDNHWPYTNSTSVGRVRVSRTNNYITQTIFCGGENIWQRTSTNSGASWRRLEPSGGNRGTTLVIYISKSGDDNNTGIDDAHPVLTINRALKIANSWPSTESGSYIAFNIGEGDWGDVTINSLPYLLEIRDYSNGSVSSYSESLPKFNTITVNNSYVNIKNIVVGHAISRRASVIYTLGYLRFSRLSSENFSEIYVSSNVNEIKSMNSQTSVFYTNQRGQIVLTNTSYKIVENISVSIAFVVMYTMSYIFFDNITFTLNSGVSVTGKKYVISGSGFSAASKTYLDTLPGSVSGTINVGGLVGGIPYGGGASDKALTADLSWKPVILQSGGNLTGNLNLYFEDDFLGKLCAFNDIYGKRIALDTYEANDCGGFLSLFKYSSESIKGGFILGARNADGSVSKNLVGGPEGVLSWDGSFTASTVYNAVWNDYAEFFPRGEETEPGDIIALDSNSEKEQYVKATKDSYLIVGAHSNTYAHLIGGEVPPEGEDFITYNLPKFIPVGLAGRINIKFKGKSRKGYPVTISDIPGVAELYSGSGHIIGYIVEDKDSNSEEIRLVKILIRHS